VIIKKPILLDGAMGTELIARGEKFTLPLWSAEANLSNPSLVTNIHQNYADEGADIITTNTFRSTAWTYEKSGLDSKNAKERADRSLMAAVDCAQKVRGEIKIAGSITTIDDCYQPKRYPGDNIAYDHYGHLVDKLLELGINLFLIETMGNLDEIEVALDILHNKEAEIFLSLILKDSKTLLDGNCLFDVIKIIRSKKVNSLLNNCNNFNTKFEELQTIQDEWGGSWGIYPNLGITNYDDLYLKRVSQIKFEQKMRYILVKKPDIIGLCCGSNINDFKILKKIVEEYYEAEN